MSSEMTSATLALFGVVVGALLTFLAQFLLHRQQERSEVRKKAIDLKNEQCLALWETLADTYHYLFFPGHYSENKVDLGRLGEHIKCLNVAIIKAEPFISHQNFLQLMEVRGAISAFFTERETGKGHSGAEHMAFICGFEAPINKARDVLREELQLVSLGISRA